jgi:hypothetical protein
VNHDHAEIAAYVAGELTGRSHAVFEEHLMTCEDCWDEVEIGRRGRQLAIRAREVAPDDLRQRVAEQVIAASGGPRPARLVVLAVAAAAVCLAAVAALAVVAGHHDPPPAIAAAVSGFRSDQLPGSHIPVTTAPDLTSLGFLQTAAGGGDLAGVPVTAYAYRDELGRRLLLYIGDRPFTTPQDAEEYGGGNAWITHDHGVYVLCGREPHVTLFVGLDEKQVNRAAEFLDLT